MRRAAEKTCRPGCLPCLRCRAAVALGKRQLALRRRVAWGALQRPPHKRNRLIPALARAIDLRQRHHKRHRRLFRWVQRQRVEQFALSLGKLSLRETEQAKLIGNLRVARGQLTGACQRNLRLIVSPCGAPVLPGQRQCFGGGTQARRLLKSICRLGEAARLVVCLPKCQVDLGGGVALGNGGLGGAYRLGIARACQRFACSPRMGLRLAWRDNHRGGWRGVDACGAAGVLADSAPLAVYLRGLPRWHARRRGSRLSPFLLRRKGASYQGHAVTYTKARSGAIHEATTRAEQPGDLCGADARRHWRW